jgi:hypothetical protein
MSSPAQMGTRDGYLPWRPAIAASSRFVVGAGTVTLGVLAGTMNLGGDVPVDWAFLLFAAVLTLGGVALLRLPRLRRLGWLAGGATTVAGLALAAFLPVREACCDAAYTFSWGLPLPWGTSAGDTPGAARAITLTALPEIDTFSAVADVVFWVYAGLLVGIAASAASQMAARMARSKPST